MGNKSLDSPIQVGQDHNEAVCNDSGAEDDHESHIYSIAFDDEPGGRLIMLGTAYFDESADANAAKIFAVSALVGIDSEWRNFRHEWKRLLRKHHLCYFKNSECVNTVGQFSYLRDKYPSLGDATRASIDIRSEFQRIITDSPCQCTGVGIDMVGFNKLDQQLEIRRNSKWESNYQVTATIMAIGGVGALLTDYNKEHSLQYCPMPESVGPLAYHDEHSLLAILEDDERRPPWVIGKEIRKARANENKKRSTFPF